MTSAPTPTQPPPPSPAPARSGGFFGRLVAALLVIVITTVVAVAVIAGGLLFFGFTPGMPQRLADSERALATAQAERAGLALQQSLVQTQVADQERRSGGMRESIDGLQEEVGSLNHLRGQLEEDSTRFATVVVEARQSRDEVHAYATAEAGRAAILAEMARRSERVERFLQRLGDIANDTAVDLQTATPLPGVTLPTEAAPTAPPTATIEPVNTATPTPEATPTKTP